MKKLTGKCPVTDCYCEKYRRCLTAAAVTINRTNNYYACPLEGIQFIMDTWPKATRHDSDQILVHSCFARSTVI